MSGLGQLSGVLLYQKSIISYSYFYSLPEQRSFPVPLLGSEFGVRLHKRQAS